MGKFSRRDFLAAIGLGHFGSLRSGQEHALELTQSTPSRFITVCAPTGFGKSLWIVVDAILSGKKCCIVTNSRGLQDQYMRDFACVGMTDIRGRNNYSCKMKEGYTCEDGWVSGCPYKGSVACDCTKAEIKASLSNLIVTNYAKWTNTRRFGAGLEDVERLYLDEAHNIPGAIAQAMQITLGFKEWEEQLGVPFPSGGHAENLWEWKQWAVNAKLIVDPELIKAQARLIGVVDVKPAWVRQLIHLRNMSRKLTVLASCKPDEWVVDQVDKGYQFDPIYPGKYGESTLYLKVPKVIAASATVRPKTMYMGGVAKNNFVFQEFPSEFNPQRCPIYYVPTMRVDSRATDLAPLWLLLDQIMSPRKQWKGIVHTISYDRQQDIIATSRHRSSMIINPKGSPASDTIDDFCDSGPGTTLISPVVGEGYDFKGDLCRWQLLCKVPFEPPSKIVKAREAVDKEYRGYQALQYMVQAFGRGMRENKDWCENFIGDEHMEWFKPRYSHLAPKSFHQFYQRTETLPPPLGRTVDRMRV